MWLCIFFQLLSARGVAQRNRKRVLFSCFLSDDVSAGYRDSSLVEFCERLSTPNCKVDFVIRRDRAQLSPHNFVRRSCLMYRLDTLDEDEEFRLLRLLLDDSQWLSLASRGRMVISKRQQLKDGRYGQYHLSGIFVFYFSYSEAGAGNFGNLCYRTWTLQKEFLMEKIEVENVVSLAALSLRSLYDNHCNWRGLRQIFSSSFCERMLFSELEELASVSSLRKMSQAAHLFLETDKALWAVASVMRRLFPLP